MSALGSHRPAIAHAAIGLAVCYAVHALLVEPTARDLSVARSRADQLAAEVQTAEAARDSLPRFTAALQQTRAEAEALTAGGRPALEQSRLFSAVMDLAAATGVQVERIAPSAGSVPAGGRPMDRAVSCEIGAIGTYNGLVGFLTGLQRDLGFVSIRAARLLPVRDGEGERIAATILTEHFAADPSPIPVPPPGVP